MLEKKMRVDKSLFSSLIEKADLRSTPHFSLRFRQNTESPGRFSVTVSKKTAKTAVERNKLRRRGYHALREVIFQKSIDSKSVGNSNKKRIFNNIDGIIFIKKGSDGLSFRQLVLEMSELLHKTS
jgi:ribonuclease P protein component